MAAKRDFYEVLGIDKNADEATIKKAYRKLAKKYHPDMNKGNPNAEKIFQEVTEAYEVLGDPKKRKLYDEYGPISLEAGFDPEKMKQAQYGNPFGNGGFYQSYSSGEPGSGYQEFHFDGSSDMDDILDKLFGKKGGFHGTGGFGGRSGFGSSGEFGSGFGGVHEERGQNIETEVPISFEEAVFGCDKRFTLSSSDGRSQNFEVHIPAGIANGQSVRLKGKGQKGYNGKDGDLLIKVKVGEKSGYERKGQDVDYYLNQAGGYSENAKKSKKFIVYMNGQVTKVKGSGKKQIEPGCEIIIPSKAKKKTNIGNILGYATTFSTLGMMVASIANLIKK